MTTNRMHKGQHYYLPADYYAAGAYRTASGATYATYMGSVRLDRRYWVFQGSTSDSIFIPAGTADVTPKEA
jgi:hypothetical protein